MTLTKDKTPLFIHQLILYIQEASLDDLVVFRQTLVAEVSLLPLCGGLLLLLLSHLHHKLETSELCP